MLKLLILTEDTDKSVSGFEQKVVKRIDSIIGRDEAIDNVYYDPDIAIKIMEVLTKELVIPFEIALEIYYLYNNNLSKIWSEDDSWLKNPVRGYEEEISVEEEVLSKYLQIPPNLLDEDTDLFGISQFVDYDTGHLYAIGIAHDINNAIDKIVDSWFWDYQSNDTSLNYLLKSDYVTTFGTDGYITITDYLYIDDWALHDIATEDARNLVEEYDDPESILNWAMRSRPDIETEYGELLNRKDDLEEQIHDSENENEIELLKDKIDVIDKEIEDLAKIAAEDMVDEEYNNTRKWMEEFPLDWLHEYGYIDKDGGKYIIGVWKDNIRYSQSRERRKYPDWIRVDFKRLKDDLYDEIYHNRASELARYDGEERTEEHNGITYYIYKTE